MKKIILIIATLGLSGCATQAVLPSKAKVAPSERVINYKSKTSEFNSTLIVVRDSGYLGSFCYAAVYVDGVKSALLEPSEKSVFYLKPGVVTVGIKGDGEACISDDIPSMREIKLEPNGIKAVRVFSEPGGNVDIKPLPNE